MSVKRIHLILTPLEAQALASVAGNGWGDGDFADWLGDGRKSAACQRAMDKLDQAIGKAAREKAERLAG